MINTMITTAALRSRTLWNAGMRNRSALAPIDAVRPMDVVPATRNGRGGYASTKQDRPPRGEPR